MPLSSKTMSSRKRDSFGRFSSGSGGTDLSRFGQESTKYKKPRNMGIHSSMPGYPGAVGAMSSGQAPPSAASLGTSYSSGVIDLGSNSTSSVPVQARPWSTTANIPPLSAGALIFARRDGKLVSHGLSKQLRSVADLPTMNWLLRESLDRQRVNNVSKASDMSSSSYKKKSGSVLGTATQPNTGWSYVGSLRNSYQAPGSPVILHNVDVFGRTKIANLFGRSVKSGDHLGICLVPVDLSNFTTEKGWAMLGPSSKTTITEDYLETLFDDAAMTAKGLGCENEVGEKFDKEGEYHCWQWLPCINGIICEEFWSLWPEKGEREDENFGVRRSGAPHEDFIDYIHLGSVSNSLMRGRCTSSQMKKAPFETNTYTLCPQLELLLE